MVMLFFFTSLLNALFSFSSIWSPSLIIILYQFLKITFVTALLYSYTIKLINLWSVVCDRITASTFSFTNRSSPSVLVRLLFMDTTTQLLGGALIARDTSSSLDEFKLYHYDPSIGGAVAFVLLFLGTTSFHTYQSFRTRCWFVIPFIIGGICKLRSSVISSRKKKNSNAFY